MTKHPPRTVTVIIRDTSPLNLEEPIRHRPVSISLTDEQLSALALRLTGSSGGTDLWEEVSCAMFEEPVDTLLTCLRVVIRDHSKYVLMNEPVEHRSVSVRLTPEQINALRLNDVDDPMGRGTCTTEEVSSVFFDSGPVK